MKRCVCSAACSLILPQLVDIPMQRTRRMDQAGKHQQQVFTGCTRCMLVLLQCMQLAGCDPRGACSDTCRTRLMRWLKHMLDPRQSGADNYVAVSVPLSCCTLRYHVADSADSAVNLALTLPMHTQQKAWQLRRQCNAMPHKWAQQRTQSSAVLQVLRGVLSSHLRMASKMICRSRCDGSCCRCKLFTNLVENVSSRLSSLKSDVAGSNLHTAVSIVCSTWWHSSQTQGTSKEHPCRVCWYTEVQHAMCLHCLGK